jgi:DNA-directed RNA polymerase specialized sigma24 family protein
MKPELDAHLSDARGLARLKAKAVIGRCGLTGDDREDIEAQLLLSVWARRRKFDCRRSSRRTFNSRVMDREVASILRYRLAGCRLQLGRPELIDGTVPDQVHGSTLSHTQRQEFWLDVAKVTNMLPTQLRETVLALRCGSPTEASQILGTARSVVYERIAQIRQAFLAAGVGPTYFAGGAR